MTLLTTALAITTILSLLLGWACYRLYVRGERREASRTEWHLQGMKEKEYTEQYLERVLEVLNRNVGGVQKRVTESVQIAEAIHLHAPDIFKQCPGLAYWLHANDQFLVNLRAAAGDRIYDPYSEHVGYWRKLGREEIFSRIYASAGLPPPANLQYPTEVSGGPASDPAAEDGLRTGLDKVV